MSGYDWNDWFQRFDLAPDTLITLHNWYPLILANRQGWPNEVALSGPFIGDLLVAETVPPDWATTLQHYLEQGELAAARILLQHPPNSDEAQLLAWQQQLDQRASRLESDFDHLKSQLLTYQRSLVSLGVTTGGEANPEQFIAKAEALFELNRLGPAIQHLDQQANELQAQLEAHRQRITAELDYLRPAAEAEPQDELRVVLLRLIDDAQIFLDNDHLARAEQLARQARILQESRDLTQFKQQSSEPEEPLLREEFPAIRAKEILAWLDGKDTAPSQHRAAFFEKWCLREWLPGQAPSKEEATSPSYETLAHLAALESGPPPFSRKTADCWTSFLQELFNLLGKQGLEPSQVEPILTRDQSRPKKTAGFWLGHFDEAFAIPHTFIDPVRLPGGLAVILWHGATDPICPKPANLQSELEKRGLTRQPVLFLAGETIYPEDRDALQRALPTAALLDERDLLQLVFCSEQPEIRAMHFARTISRQLPIEDASPFSAQSDVTGSMFVGRRDVLKKFSAPNGPTILYGGRKLGKSSIFRQLQRDFENRADRWGQNIAVYINAINVVDGMGIKHTLLPEIVHTLNHALVVRGFKGEAEALEVYISPENGLTSDQFSGHIRNLLRKLPRHRFLLLIDEADSLLQYLNVGTDALLDPSKRLGWEFRALIQESGGRFDVRFAGFQDISRVTQITTGPFYNFRPGQAQYPLSVLPPNEARELVRRPLQLLDVIFSDDSLVELILDYTGQHPALIQEFCRLLYKQVRSSRGGSPLKVTPSDVETVWKDPEFRRDVVRAIHLNVETRNTKPEKILRLLLYLWVNNMMVPTDYEIPVVADSAHLYQLLARTFGREPARRQVTKSDLDKYLADLATLGVLKKHGSGYAFHYRYFARLLYYDTFHGQLDDTVIKELWDSIITHEDRSPRMPICIDNRLSISPFRMLDQEQLESERDHVMLALGAPGTGKTRFFKWLQGSQETLEVRIVDASALQFETLKAQLAAILEIEVETATWQMLADQTLTCCTKLEKPTLVVFDNIDTIAAHPDWPLLYWPNPDDAVAGDDGLLFTLARLTRASSGKLRFVLTGAFSLARFWIEVQEVLADVAQRVVTHRLTRSELDAWFMGTRLLATTEVKRRLWQLTRGDWRLLNSLLHWLEPNLEELREADLNAFEQTLIAQPGSETLPELQRVLQHYDPQARETFQALAAAARELGTGELEAKTWCEFLPAHRLPGEWLTELRAAVLLQELDQSAPEGEVVVVPAQDKWFHMLIDHHV
jgi:hypothetical protein